MVSTKPTSVLIVDDSAVIRAVIARTLKEQDDIEVVGSSINGQIGLEQVKALRPDIVILDIEMPVMDGITALPLILKENPDTKVLICSTLSARGADITIKALGLGAIECLLKPGVGSIVSAKEFQDELVKVIRSISAKPVKNKYIEQELEVQPQPTSEYTVRDNRPIVPAKIVAIGSSTGGPKALMSVLKEMNNIAVPIVITQHMPKTFTELLAKHIEQDCNISCKEGADGDILEPGHAYVAPGGYHMKFQKEGEKVLIRIVEEPPENFCRPSVDPMIRSLMDIYDDRILGVILTGMGQDGLKSCVNLVEKGGHVIAQDQQSSVVWGMPGAVAMANICSAVLPLDGISSWVKDNVKRI